MDDSHCPWLTHKVTGRSIIFISRTRIKDTYYILQGVWRLLHLPGSASIQRWVKCDYWYLTVSDFRSELFCSVSRIVIYDNCCLKLHPCLLKVTLTFTHPLLRSVGSDFCSVVCSLVSQTCSQMGLSMILFLDWESFPQMWSVTKDEQISRIRSVDVAALVWVL